MKLSRKVCSGAGMTCLWILIFPAIAQARPLYEGGHGEDSWGIGLSLSVLFMMSMPFVLIGLFAAFLWRTHSPHSYYRIQDQVLSFFRRRWIYPALALIAVTAVSALIILPGQAGRNEDAAVQTLKQYVQAIYPRNYAAAYPLISIADRHVKSEQDYLRENESLTGFGLEIAQKLASRVEYKNLRTEMQDNLATIRVTLVVPDSDNPALNDILFAESATNASLSEAQKQALRAKLDDLIQQRKLPTFESEQEFTLTRELGQWRVFLGWGDGITVRLIGSVAEGLAWEFGPTQPIIRALPGKTYRAVYRARNLTDTPITGKAAHRVEPKDKGRYFHELQCFCLIQETLQPGEAKEMLLTFTVDPDIPPSVREFEVSYEFYPIEKFPADAEEMRGGK